MISLETTEGERDRDNRGMAEHAQGSVRSRLGQVLESPALVAPFPSSNTKPASLVRKNSSRRIGDATKTSTDSDVGVEIMQIMSQPGEENSTPLGCSPPVRSLNPVTRDTRFGNRFHVVEKTVSRAALEAGLEGDALIQSIFPPAFHRREMSRSS